jgi:hypothetical protein
MNIHAFSRPEVLKLLVTSETGLPQSTDASELRI